MTVSDGQLSIASQGRFDWAMTMKDENGTTVQVVTESTLVTNATLTAAVRPDSSTDADPTDGSEVGYIITSYVLVFCVSDMVATRLPTHQDKHHIIALLK